MKPLILEELTWVELSKKIGNVKLAVVPVGSYEQHGPNMTFATDTKRAYEFSKMVGDHYGEKLLICPPVGYGISVHHMKFPGTMTLRPSTFISVIKDIAWSLKQHGLEKVLYITGHGGNRNSLGVATVDIKMELEMDVYWTSMGGGVAKEFVNSKNISQNRGHACEVETSQSMFLSPEIVREEALSKGDLNIDSKYMNRSAASSGGMYWDFKEVTSNGALGDARKSNKKFGEEVNQKILEKIINYIDELILESDKK